MAPLRLQKWLYFLLIAAVWLTPPDAGSQPPEGAPPPTPPVASEPTRPPAEDQQPAPPPGPVLQIPSQPTPSPLPEPTPPPGTVHVAGFILSGNVAVGAWELAPILTPYVGRDLSLRDLEALTDLVTKEYQRRGYALAKAYIPEQRIRAGIVEIGVLEGHLGRLEITGNTRYSSAYLRRYFAPLYEEGAIKYASLERALLLLNDNPNLTVTALLQPGQTVGSTDIMAKAEEKRRIHVNANVNNFGFPSVSRERYTIGADVSNVIFDGSLAAANLVFGNDTRSLFFQDGSYSVPLNGQGTRLVVSGSNGRFDVGGALSFLKISGKIKTYDISVTHPFLRTRVDNLYVDAGYTSKDNRLFVLDTLVGTDALRMLKLGVSYDRTDMQGRTFVSVYGYQGLGKVLGGMADNAPQASRLGADNLFTKVTVAASRIQTVWRDLVLVVKGTGQLSGGILPIIEEMLLGGADSVRGYSLGERIGDEGYTVSAELRYPVPYVPDAQLVLFVDNGAVQIRGNPAGLKPSYSLTGAGPGIRVGLPYYDATLRVDLGFPIDPSVPLAGTLSGGSSPTLYFMVSARM